MPTVSSMTAVPAYAPGDAVYLVTAGGDSRKLVNLRVATIAAMTAIAAPTNGMSVEVVEEGRGGFFVFDTSATAAGNGGTTFSADDATTGSWVRRYDGAVSVKWFGAAGDGTTPDHVAIQAAIDSIPEGGEVFIGGGTYVVGAGIVLKQKVSIRGAGKFSTVIKSGYTSASGAVISHTVNLDGQSTLSGFSVDADNVGYGIKLGETSTPANFAHSSLRDIYITKAESAGLWLEKCISVSFFDIEAEGNAGHGLLIQGTAATDAVNDNKFYGCRFSENTLHGAYLNGTNRSPVHSVFHGCVFEANGTSAAPKSAIYAKDVNALIVDSCWIEAAGDEMDYGVHIDGASIGIGAVGAKIINNTFRLIDSSSVKLVNADNIFVGWNISGSSPNDGASSVVDVDAACTGVTFFENYGQFDGAPTSALVLTDGTNGAEVTWIRPGEAGVKKSFATFGSADATPSVAYFERFATGASTLTITDFDDGVPGQLITIRSAAAITFDVTGTSLFGGTADIVTASGDVTQWYTQDGNTWRLVGFVDASADNSTGA